MVDDTIRNESITLLPEYQENFSKDLLSTVYRVDPVTGQPAGLAAQSPLYGKPVLDANGQPVYETDANGQVRLDIRGQPIQKVQGGVPKAEVVPMTDAQKRASEMAVQGIGAYAPMMGRAADTMNQGVATLGGTTGAFDPNAYKAFYDPYTEDVINATQRDINRQGRMEQNNLNAQAVQAGAFGGSRQAVAGQELARNTAQLSADTGARLRSAGYSAAQQQAQSVFENQQQRGQSAAQIFQGLGTSQGALGEAAQAAGQRDVNALYNVGTLDQAQQQSEYDVQRANALEAAYEPQARATFMADILNKVPSSQSTLGISSVPTPSYASSILGTAMNLSSAGGGGILGALTNRSG